MTKGARSLRLLKDRFPARKDLVGIFGIVVFIVHAWSIWQFLFYLPSFVLKYDAGEIIAIFFYHLTFAFLESLLVCGLLAILSAALPMGWLRNGFVHKAFLLILLAIAGSIALQKSMVDGLLVIDPSRPYIVYTGVAAGLLLVAFLILAARLDGVRQALDDLVDRFSVMLLLFLPLDAIAVAVVAIRLLR
jgi:hypothetical protein